ncbi:MAG: uroporphyrinogen decarboxylase family protein [Anaerolineae bacterium]
MGFDKVTKAFYHCLYHSGNFEPVAVTLRGTPEEVYEATRYCLQNGAGRVFGGTGCEIPDGTPHENLLTQARALQELGRHKVK